MKRTASQNENSSELEPKAEQIDYIQAEYRIIDAKELYVTADNMEAITDSDGNEMYINTENYTDQMCVIIEIKKRCCSN